MLAAASVRAAEASLRLRRFPPPRSTLSMEAPKPWAKAMEETSGGRIGFRHFVSGRSRSLAVAGPVCAGGSHDGFAGIMRAAAPRAPATKKARPAAPPGGLRCGRIRPGMVEQRGYDETGFILHMPVWIGYAVGVAGPAMSAPDCRARDLHAMRRASR